MFRIAMQMFSLRVAFHYKIQGGIKLYLSDERIRGKNNIHTHIFTKQMRICKKRKKRMRKIQMQVYKYFSWLFFVETDGKRVVLGKA